MKTTYIYPGSFCPPTFGHLSIVKRAAEIFDKVIVLCSQNPSKNGRWFNMAEAKALWQGYSLPENVSVEIFGQRTHNTTDIVMIRGIRSEDDLEDEREVMLLNHKKYGIDKYFYIFSEDHFSGISSSKARALAAKLELESLADSVSPLIISALLESALRVKNIFMVVGKPGAGKSTFLKMLNQENPHNVHINTDNFNEQLKPLLRRMFPGEDLIQLALEREYELKRAIKKPWMDLLKQALANTEEGANLFVEIPYGLQTDKMMFRFIGGKILYIGCENRDKYKERVSQRGTPELLPFVDRIPDLEETRQIVEDHRLSLNRVDSSGSLADLEKQAKKLNELLNQEVE